MAFVVPGAGAQADEPAVIAHCRERLASFKVPVRVMIVDSLPTVEGKGKGKVSDFDFHTFVADCYDVKV